MKIPLISLFALLVAAGHAAADTIPGPAEVGARQIPLAEKAYAGSSINVVAGSRQTLYTDSVHQYAGFYVADGRLVLAKRRLGEDSWHIQPTGFTADPKDAHNAISLVVDGEGYLHLAWGHHDTPLNYSRSLESGGLAMDEPHSMVGKAEKSATYPQFFRLADGGLLFLYREGRSGNGRLVLNHYDAERQKWSRRQDNLIDGESRRSAYWDMSIDKNGRLHLAWNWRETPDVASNHDLLYARSDDGGKSWQRSDGSDYQLPITQASAEVATAIPQNRNLMNPPAVGANRLGQPVIASYWSPEQGARPRFNLVHRDERGWHTIPGPKAGRDFTLKGQGTKRPPISRAALLVDSGWENGAHVVYRDDSRGGRVLAASVDDLQDPEWYLRFLTEKSVGAWEPSIDPAQWQRMKQAQLLLQPVTQLDGDDHSGSNAEPTPLSLLIWSAVWEHHQRRAATGDVAESKNSVAAEKPPQPQQVLDYARRVAEWQWAHMPDPTNWHFQRKNWGVCPLYIGSLDIAPLIPDAGLEARVLQQARENRFEPQEDSHDADIYCVSQAYLRLYKKYRREEMLAPTKKLFDRILAKPSPYNLDWGYAHSRDRWSWSDSLFMGPMSWLLMWEVTGDRRYLDFMNREWWATTERLYREELGLYFRDESYLDLREKNGKTVHWARGTAWVIAGLVQVIEHLPQDHPDRERYTALFRRMAAAFAEAQQGDGLWRPGLLDPQTHNARESSGSAFISFALASGINQGLIEREIYLPRVQKAWSALTANVADDGKLRNVQPVGAGPHGFDPDNAEPFAAGAFLLLAKEMYLLSGGESL
jgi:rhamnogalacturonyl hydrolase YesR